MTPFTLAQSLLESNYTYACADIPVPPELADFIIDWGRLNIPEENLFVDEDGGKGAERDIHCTVKYGLLDREPGADLRQVVKETKPFPVVLGKVSLFTTNPKYDVVKLEVKSPWLIQLNKRVCAACEHVDTFPGYLPHVTIAYLKKGTADDLAGTDIFAEQDVAREFIAAGMHFSGPGDSEAGERADEMLLFSRTKDVVDEAAVQPTPAMVDEIMHIIRKAAGESAGEPTMFVHLVNIDLEERGVFFSKMTRYGALNPAGACSEDGIELRSPTKAELQSRAWLAGIRTVLHHEAVHATQMQVAKDPSAVRDSADRYMAGVDGALDHGKYLKQKQEVMAYAATMVEEWRVKGLPVDEMLRRLRTGNWNYGINYWFNRRTYPKTFNLFVKYANEYINQLRTEESVLPPPDPFAACQFPDPDRIKQFLRQRRRKAARPVL